MTLRCKRPRPLVREDKPYRDARLFVIATEDTYAPVQYFDLFKNPRVQVRVLPTEGGLSSPEHVLERLDAYVEEFQKTEGDEFWLMLDTDHWIEASHIANFKQVCSEASKKGFQLAHSNPCFKIWLLLHFRDLAPSDHFTNCDQVVEQLKVTLGKYNKRTTINSEQFPLESIFAAVDRAEKLDKSPGDRWPQTTGSHVYKVVKMLLPS